MSLISFTPLQDGVTSVAAAATNNPLNTIYNDYNGNITDANIASNAAIAGSKITPASLPVAGLVQTFTNSGTAGGTFYYMNLGGFKLMWGITNSIGASSTGANSGLTLPSFFSTIQYAGTTTGTATNSVQQFILTVVNNMTSLTLTAVALNGSTTSVVGNVFIIGT